MAHPILLYDGLCGFCDGVVRFVLKRDRAGAIRFATIQGSYARGVFERHPQIADIDSLVLIEEPGTPSERVTVKSDGVLRLASYMGWPWRAAPMLRLMPRVIRDAAYDLFGRHRYRLFGRYDACRIPSPEQRARFIDV